MIQTYPDLGLNVNVALTNGATLIGYWDGQQWWVGVNDMPDDLPVANDFVAGWSSIT